ncbi:hypothetical protein EI42_03702 [Thermosporothrix hazakensis]|jgi:hypothetical protein|uniref:HTH cro/C1-type domain-containing protein n=1 Tax=Thermosporothrix hazakensis TaxID=644383 RepID=A0A326U3Z0_THEHA|nr:DUF6603 domain-containing protein [Thermosporothrix hazakensis]PZW27139.1 hypothetical protein EI42_03702 [Thermosporothrix hazakensis]GCE50424.1 hypothetical protein KTH_52930 [Thermosporothrix hazakensis]
MSLEKIQQALLDLKQQRTLTLSDIARLVPGAALTLELLPRIEAIQLPGVQIRLEQERLTLTDTITWGKVNEIAATITITYDPASSQQYLIACSFQVKQTLAIPGISWLAMKRFQVSGESIPLSLASSLASQADIAIETDLVVDDVSLPLRIASDPTAGIQLQLRQEATLDAGSALNLVTGPQKDIQVPGIGQIALHQFQVCFAPRRTPVVSQISIEMGSPSEGQGWEVLPSVQLEEYRIGITILDPLGSRRISGLVAASMKLGRSSFAVTAQRTETGSWFFQGVIEQVSGELLQDLGDQFGVTIPESLKRMTLKHCAITFDTSTGTFSCALELDITLAGETFALTTTLRLKRVAGKYQPEIRGTLQLDNATLSIEYEEQKVIGEWKDEQNPLTLEKLASALKVDPSELPDIPSELTPDLSSVRLIYDLSQESGIALSVTSPHYGKAVVVIFQDTNTKKRHFFCGIEAGLPVKLSDLPLLGTILDREITVSIEKIHLLLATVIIGEQMAERVNKLIGEGYPHVPATGITALLCLSAEAHFGELVVPLTLQLGGQRQTVAEYAEAMLLPGRYGLAFWAYGEQQTTELITLSTTADTTLWLDVEKSFGPLKIQKLGMQYTGGKLAILANLALTAGGLTIRLEGFGLSSPLKQFAPQFLIRGLSVTAQEGPVIVSGGLIGTLDPVNFVGELIVQTANLSIFALGAYTQVQDHPSFFLYAVLNYPIGGPTFFFVTGLAGGLGFNRKLVLPDVEHVASFPLVEWAKGNGDVPSPQPGEDIGKKVSEVLDTLINKGVITPGLGDYWLAAGIHFTSFEVIDSFALVTLSIGTDVEIALLGLSTLTLPPPKAGGSQVIVAQIELALKGSFSLHTGLLALSGQLTSNSFLFSRDCRLTGGFAFYSWFSGSHAGEFVITVGGYNPHFTIPAHYPQVPRLGINWQISTELSVKAELYFALTSCAVMAGGRLEALWQSGGVKAWFTVWADFLMLLQPFHYYISAGISLGVSFDINLLITRKTITITIGVGLEIWGPDFTGKAVIDLALISFTIHFGSSGRQTDTTISWNKFVQQLLPQQKTTTKLLTAGPDAQSTADPSILHINVTKGLTKTLTQDTFVVNPGEFECTVTSAIPVKTLQYDSKLSLAPDTMQPQREGSVIQPNTEFGVGPTGTESSAFQSTCTVRIETNQPSTFYLVRILQNIPKSLWQKQHFNQQGVPQIQNPLQDTTLTDVLVGARILPYVDAPRHTLPIALSILQYTTEQPQSFWWNVPSVAKKDPFRTETVVETIKSAKALTNRNALLQAMEADRLLVSPNLQVDALSNPATYDLFAPPYLRLLGEEKPIEGRV